MRIRPLSEMLTEVAGSLQSLNHEQTLVRVTSVELTLPVNVKLASSQQGLVFCTDLPAWRWRTDFDSPFGQLRLRLEEAPQRIVQ